MIILKLIIRLFRLVAQCLWWFPILIYILIANRNECKHVWVYAIGEKNRKRMCEKCKDKEYYNEYYARWKKSW